MAQTNEAAHYAVIRTGGVLVKVSPGEEFDVARIKAEEGETVSLDQVLAVVRGEERVFGRPFVPGASVRAKVVDHFLGQKKICFKMKRRKGYRRKKGVRSKLTRLRVEEIQLA